jgi:quercetin dioxygenase-like cupin family protein
MRQKFLFAVIALGLGYVTIVQARDEAPKPAAHVMLTPDAINWQPLPREWSNGPPPPGFKGQSEIAIIQGDPTKEGAPFVIRIRSAPGTQIPPHWHPVDENITVLSGTICVGTGDKFDENACQDMPTGSYVVLAKGRHHFVVAKGDVVQVHGIGPFKIYWVK